MPLHLPVGACAQLQYVCSHARAHLAVFALACSEWPVETGSHTSSIHTSLTTRQSKQLGDNVSVGVGVGVWLDFYYLMEPKRPDKSRNPGKAVTQ